MLGIGETHILGQVVWSANGNNEYKLWEGMGGGEVWAKISENYQGREIGCAILLSPRVHIMTSK